MTQRRAFIDAPGTHPYHVIPPVRGGITWYIGAKIGPSSIEAWLQMSGDTRV